MLRHARAAGGKWRAPVRGSIMWLVCHVTSELQGNGGYHQEGNIMSWRYGDTIELQWEDEDHTKATWKAGVLRHFRLTRGTIIRWSMNHKHNSGRVTTNGLESPNIEVSPTDLVR